MCATSQTKESPHNNTSWLLKVENTSHFHQTFSDNWCNLDNINSSIGYKVYDWLQVGIQIGGAINEIPDYSDAIYVDGFYHNVPLRKKFIPNIGVKY